MPRHLSPHPHPQSTTQGAADALQGLRAATGALHAQLDEGLPVGQDGAVLADYISHLQVLRPWLVRSQATLRATGSAGLGAAAGRIDERLAKLDADLADAGQPASITAAPETSAQYLDPDAEPAGYGWGLAYVVEGSALGGRVLFKRLHERLAPHPLRYLEGSRMANPRAPWTSFTAELDAYLTTPERRLDAQRGAVAAFSDLLGAMKPPTGE